MLKRFILWDYARASWQYDVMVGIIVAFIFLTPRDWFRDQPRIPHVAAIARPSENGGNVLFVDSEVLAGVPEPQRLNRLRAFLKTQPSTAKISITRVEPILDSEGELQGYMAFVHP
ncbi:MAG: hypothetical protein ABSH42_04830 [Bryobacteraceae bacterium]|jgi:hypothetical protein